VASKNRKSHRTLLALTAAVTLGALFSGAALARTQSGPDCAEITQDLDSLVTAPLALAVDEVDHQAIQQNGAAPLDGESVDVTTMDLSTPQLRLGPRVSNALQDIFGQRETAAFDEESLEMTVSPVAETEDSPAFSELPAESDSATDGEEEIDLPLLQRQMYRTDI
jgi:hypothetical protein